MFEVKEINNFEIRRGFVFLKKRKHQEKTIFYS